MSHILLPPPPPPAPVEQMIPGQGCVGLGLGIPREIVGEVGGLLGSELAVVLEQLS